MKARELIKLGIPPGDCKRLAVKAVAAAAKAGMDRAALRASITDLVADPEEYRDHEHFGDLAKALVRTKKARARYEAREESAPHQQWGEGLDSEAVKQMRNACSLPVSVAGALMPDAHVGYGLPIGGVLATENAVIPYAVGVDIACRMKMTVLDLAPKKIEKRLGRLQQVIEDETRFGIGASFKKRRQHPVMDADWSFTQTVSLLKDKAWSQLGTSGSGNHFVEFGLLHLDEDDLGLESGTYLALLSHSGSRGTGAEIASHFSKLAMSLRPELPRELVHLSWLDLDTEAGQEYWQAMQLMGRYASANHELIHRHIADNLGVGVLLDIENHHNFAWEETHAGKKVVVHRKGATPAGEGTLGIIPGSMGAPGYVVRGKGNPASLDSAAHGAGRRMSRKKAKEHFTWEETLRFLKDRRVTLISAGLDEAPMAYKDIGKVMGSQTDLVEAVARFEPRLVKMAPAGERPED